MPLPPLTLQLFLISSLRSIAGLIEVPLGRKGNYFSMRNKTFEDVVDSVALQLFEVRQAKKLSHETVAEKAGL